MSFYKSISRLSIALVSLSYILIGNPVQADSGGTGVKGAKIYCFMRESGNSHDVSWMAAYEFIKRQSNGLFKTSPKHSAVMIIESVVKNQNEFQNCGLYLGDLFKNSTEIQIESQPENEEIKGNRYSF